jgi:hypothetical protein
LYVIEVINANAMSEYQTNASPQIGCIGRSHFERLKSIDQRTSSLIINLANVRTMLEQRFSRSNIKVRHCQHEQSDGALAIRRIA